MDALWRCLCCGFGNASTLNISGHRYSIVKLLGDGGYAFVYLVKREDTGDLFALKKIRCMFGGESVANAMREIEACDKLKSTHSVVSCVDSTVVQEEDGSKTVYIVMPYYQKGTLQDRIDEAMAEQTHLPEKVVIKYALGIARALMSMHGLHIESDVADQAIPVQLDNENQESDRLLDYHEMGELTPYAHRDLKPANVMFDDDDNVVLIDLGSCSEAKVDVSSRQRAVQLQDMAAEHCTLPFRAPELFEVRTGSRIDERVDVWGFGCTLYCMMYGANPFEREEQHSGGNINICIARGNFSFPSEPAYSPELMNIVRMCLTVKSADRPSMEVVSEKLNELIAN